MDLLKLKNTLKFNQDDNGVLYKKIHGFLYTIDVTPDVAQILVNLPELNADEKKLIKTHLEDYVHYVNSRFVQNGIKISFNLAILDDPKCISKFAKSFSSFLSDASIEFSNKKIDVVFSKNMYAFIPLEKPIEKTDDKNGDSELSENKPEKKRLSTQLALIIAYGVITLIYCLISLFAIKYAAAVGYIMGWIPAMILVKRNFKAKTVYTCTLIVSFISLLFATVYIFLYYFLSQSHIYTAGDFILQSLTPSHCLFNMVLAYILAFFGTYSTVPAKAKKLSEDVDFK